jgi:hypothetical protein
MFGTQAYATAHSTGALSRIRVLDYLLVPAFSERVRAVLETISEEKMSPPFLNREDSIALNIGIGVQWQADTVPAHRRLFRIKLPRYNLPFSPAGWPKDAKAPIYPSIAETRGVSDSVAVTFTVLADGTVPTQSIEVQAGHNIEIIRAVYERLSTAKYLPGHVGGCAVASRGLQSFMFKMPGRR